MRLYFEAKAFSWKGEIRLFDELGNVKYVAKGQSAWRKDFILYDDFGNKLMEISDYLWAFLDKYDIIINDKVVAQAKTKFKFARLQMDVSGLDWFIESNISGTEVMITQGDILIGKVTRKFFSMHDKCMVEIYNPQNELLVAGLVIAIQSYYAKAAAAAAAAT